MRAIAASALVVGLALAPVTVASAAGVVELSSDGSTWGSSLGSPLFTTAPELVPLGSESASFWVRNSAPDDAYLRLTVNALGWSGSTYAASLNIATSVPEMPMATPISAFFRAGASLTPSPVTATT